MGGPRRVSKWLRFCLVFPLLFLTACGSVPPEVEEEARRQFEEARREAERQIGEAIRNWWEQVEDRARREVQEFFDDSVRHAEEWAGRQAPAELGTVAPSQTPEVPETVIKDAFDEAFMEAGGGRNLGWPTGVAQVEDGYIIQFLEQDDEERSAIIMEDDRYATQAYYLLPPFYTVLEGIGGPAEAGMPTSNPEWEGAGRFALWARDRRTQQQSFALSQGAFGRSFGLARGADGEAVQVIPPHFWEAYQEEGGATELGYPLSSYPLEDTVSTSDPRYTRLNNADQTLLDAWQAQPFHIQTFSKGSIFYTSGWTDYETLMAEALRGGETNLTASATSAFMGRARGTSGEALILDACLQTTLEDAWLRALGQTLSDVVREIEFLLVETGLTAFSLGTDRPVIQVGVEIAHVILERASGTEWDEVAAAQTAGLLVDSVYSKAITDYLSKPLAAFTEEAVQLEYEAFEKDRISREIIIPPDGRRAGAHVAMTYDPWTHMVTGMIHSGCNENGYLFQYRVHPDSATPVYEATAAWPGGVRFYDPVTGAEID